MLVSRDILLVSRCGSAGVDVDASRLVEDTLKSSEDYYPSYVIIVDIKTWMEINVKTLLDLLLAFLDMAKT